MAPNSSVKVTSVSAISCEPEQKKLSDAQKIRTDFVLQNIYSYLVKSVHSFEAIKPANNEEKLLLYELIRIVDEFKFRNGGKIQALCAQLEITMDTLDSTLHGVSNELFVEGITWSRIIALFVFVALLTLHSLERNLSEDVVDEMYGCFCCLVKENLKPWIDDHGGWNGILSLKKDKPPGWSKGLWQTTASVIGTLAHISNLYN